MMQYQHQLVLEFYHYKLSSSLFPKESISKKYLVFMEGYYRNKIIKSAEYQLKNGTQLSIPWSDRLDQIVVHYYYLDEKLKMELGYSSYRIPNERGFSFDEPNRIALDILPNGAINRIGKVLCLMSVEKFYADDKEEADRLRKNPPVKNMSFHIDSVVPGFRFRRLAKAVNWNKIRTIDLDRVVEMNDVSTILGCVDDVALGDAAEEDCDPRLLRALHVAQFTTQYLLSSKKLMDEKKKIIKKALNVFDEEEEVLDLKITKYRARKKAMMREMEEMDRVMESYRRTLIALRPRLHNYKLDEILVDSDDAGEDIRVDDYIRKNKKNERKKSKKSKNVKYNFEDGEDDDDEEESDVSSSDERQQKSKSKKQPSSKLSDNRHELVQDKKPSGKVLTVGGKLNIAKEEESDDEPDLIVPRRKTSQIEKPPLQEDRKETIKGGWKVAKASSNSRDDYDERKAETTKPIPLQSKPAAELPPMRSSQITRYSGLVDDEEEEDPNAKVKSFTSFKPITVNRKSMLEEQYKVTNEVSDEEVIERKREETIKPVSKTTTMEVSTFSKKILPSQSAMKQPPPEPSLPDVIQKQNQEEMSEKSNTMNLTDKLSKNQSDLLEFAKRKKELAMTMESERASTIRSSSGFESTNALSVDSLNLPSYKMQQIVDETNVADQTMNLTSDSIVAAPSTDLPLPRASNVIASDIKDSKTWTPSSASPAIIDDPVISKFDARLNNTFPPSASVATNSRPPSQAQVDPISSVPDASSLLMESFDSNINPLVQEPSMDYPNVQYDDDFEDEQSENASAEDDNNDTTTGVPVTLSIDIDRDGSNTLSGPPTKLSEADSPLNYNADAKSYPVTNIAGSNNNPLNSSYYAAKKSSASSFKQSPRAYKANRPTQDEDDPFSPGADHQSSYFVSHTGEDVDQSQSITIDFDLDLDHDKSTGRHRGNLAEAKSGKSGPPKSPYSRVNYNSMNDDIGAFGESSTYSQEGYNSSLTQKSSSPSSNIFNQTAYGGNRTRSDSGENDDMVLLGTGKYPSGKVGNFTLSDSSRSKYSSDTYDKDSLVGSGTGGSGGSGGSGSGVGGLNTPLKIQSSEGNMSFSNNSGGYNQSTELSPVFEGLKDSISQLGELSYSSLHPPGQREGDSHIYHQQKQQEQNEVVWEVGRAPLDLIELADAIEFHISAVRFNSNVSRFVKEFYVVVEFLDVMSGPSPTVVIRSDSIAQPLSYYLHMVANDEMRALLTEEVAELRENLCCTVYIYNKAENSLIGQASLELWAMIEHSCNVLRQEANIYTPNMSSSIGSVVFDVKGHRLLTACATE